MLCKYEEKMEAISLEKYHKALYGDRLSNGILCISPAIRAEYGSIKVRAGMYWNRSEECSIPHSRPLCKITNVCGCSREPVKGTLDSYALGYKQASGMKAYVSFETYSMSGLSFYLDFGSSSCTFSQSALL